MAMSRRDYEVLAAAIRTARNQAGTRATVSEETVSRSAQQKTLDSIAARLRDLDDRLRTHRADATPALIHAELTRLAKDVEFISNHGEAVR